MENSTIEYNLDDFIECSNKIDNRLVDLSSDIESIKKLVVLELNEFWKGDSYNAALQSFNEIYAVYQELLNKISIIKDNLKIIRDLYRNHEEESASIK